MNKFLLMLSLILFSTINYKINAQETRDSVSNPAIEFLKNEKLRITPEELLDRYLHPEKYKKLQHKNPEEENLLSDENEVLVADDEQPESEVHAAINPLNPANMVISPIRQNFDDMENYCLCPVYYTFDSGKTWQTSDFITKPYSKKVIIRSGGDPVFVFDSKGNLFFSWINIYYSIKDQNIDSCFAALFWAKSTDGGKTFNFDEKNYFGDRIFADSYMKTFGQLTQLLDKQWMAADFSNSAYKNSIYLSAIKFDFVSQTNRINIVIYRKRENEKQFNRTPVIIDKLGLSSVQFGSIGVDPFGYVHYTFYGYSGNSQFLYHCLSTDGGVTFSTPKKVSSLIGSMNQIQGTEYVTGVPQSRQYPSPYMTVDNSNGEYKGNLYLTWSATGINSSQNKGMEIYFSKSTDKGTTWSVPTVVNDDKMQGVHNFYSNIAVNQNGVIAVSWYDRRQFTSNSTSLTDFYIGLSFDGGKTFINQKVNNIPTRFDMINNINKNFGIGEYNAIMMSKDYAYPVWADGRKNNGDLNIYIAKVSLDKNTSVRIEEIKSINGLLNISSISPNPASDVISINFNLEYSGEIKFEITDIKGSIVSEVIKENFNSGENNYTLNVSGLNSGTYFIKLTAKNSYSVKQFSVVR